MKTGTIAMLVVVGTVAAIAVGLWRRSSPVGDAEPGSSALSTSATAGPPGASPSADAPSIRPTPAPRPLDPAWQTPSSPSPRYAEPEQIETLLGQFFAEQSGLQVVSLSSIRCGATACEIALSGTEVNPRYVNAYADLQSKLFGTRREEFRILSGGLGTREIAPGAREYVITFEYQPFVDLSADPLIAARQYAACAAAWRRQTENPTPDEYVRRYLAQADRYVALAASVLGEEEAARVAAETRGGPLIRECGLGL